GRDIVEEVAETFDLLPGGRGGLQPGEERADAARIFNAAGRSELWAAGAGVSDERGRAQAGVGRAEQVRHEREVERELEGGEAAGEVGATPGVEDLGRAFRRWDGKGDS